MVDKQQNDMMDEEFESEIKDLDPMQYFESLGLYESQKNQQSNDKYNKFQKFEISFPSYYPIINQIFPQKERLMTYLPMNQPRIQTNNDTIIQPQKINIVHKQLQKAQNVEKSTISIINWLENPQEKVAQAIKIAMNKIHTKSQEIQKQNLVISQEVLKCKNVYNAISLLDICKENPALNQVCLSLQNEVQVMRQVQSDNNDFYRAIMYSYIENLIYSDNQYNFWQIFFQINTKLREFYKDVLQKFGDNYSIFLSENQISRDSLTDAIINTLIKNLYQIFQQKIISLRENNNNQQASLKAINFFYQLLLQNQGFDLSLILFARVKILRTLQDFIEKKKQINIEHTQNLLQSFSMKPNEDVFRLTAQAFNISINLLKFVQNQQQSFDIIESFYQNTDSDSFKQIDFIDLKFLVHKDNYFILYPNQMARNIYPQAKDVSEKLIQNYN